LVLLYTAWISIAQRARSRTLECDRDLVPDGESDKTTLGEWSGL
jgi:hypothetical protein